MQRRGAPVKNLLNELWDGGTSSPVPGELRNLLGGGDLAGDKEPEETFGKRLRPTRGLGEELLDLGNSLATETNTLI